MLTGPSGSGKELAARLIHAQGPRAEAPFVTVACAAIAPAEVSRVYVDSDEKALEIIVPDDQLSLAIGKKGQNVRLAARLTGWKIDIKSESRAAEAQAQEFAETEEDESADESFSVDEETVLSPVDADEAAAEDEDQA